MSETQRRFESDAETARRLALWKTLGDDEAVFGRYVRAYIADRGRESFLWWCWENREVAKDWIDAK